MILFYTFKDIIQRLCDNICSLISDALNIYIYTNVLQNGLLSINEFVISKYFLKRIEWVLSMFAASGLDFAGYKPEDSKGHFQKGKYFLAFHSKNVKL